MDIDDNDTPKKIKIEKEKMRNFGDFYYYNGALDYECEFLLTSKLIHFWTLSKLKELIVPLNDDSNISRRIIQWFVTNYSKEFNTIIKGKDQKPFVVNLEYKMQMRQYNRLLFDVCRRRGHAVRKFDKTLQTIVLLDKDYDKNNDHKNKIYFFLNDDVHYSTAAQLNFIQWAHLNGVLEYIETHKDKIETHHTQTLCEKSTSNVFVNRNNNIAPKRRGRKPKNYIAPSPQHNDDDTKIKVEGNNVAIKKKKRRGELTSSIGNHCVVYDLKELRAQQQQTTIFNFGEKNTT